MLDRFGLRPLGAILQIGALALLSLLGPSVVVSPAHAADTPPARSAPATRIDVLVLEDPSTDWGRRVRGQLSDLPATARIRTMRTLERRDPGRDRALAAPNAALTAWLTSTASAEPSTPRGTFIALWFAGAPSPSLQRIADAWSALGPADRSAALELAALSVRSAVRSLLIDTAPRDGPSIASRERAQESTFATPPARSPPARRRRSGDGVTDAADAGVDAPALPHGSRDAQRPNAEAAAAALATVAPPTPEAPATEPPATEPPASIIEPALEPTSIDSPFPVAFGLELGAAWQFYGRTAPGDPGVHAGLSLLGDAWCLQLLGHFGWPMPARLGPAEFDLQRHALLLEVSGVAYDRAGWRLGPLARAGLTWLRRDDARGGTGADSLDASRPASYRSPFFGLGAIAERQLSDAISLALRGVLNIETAIPTFTLVDAAGAPVSTVSPWNAQPSIELGARWRW